MPREREMCPVCRGYGSDDEATCPECGGSGWIDTPDDEETPDAG